MAKASKETIASIAEVEAILSKHILSQASNDPGSTTSEIAESWGIGISQARKKLKSLESLGLADIGKSTRPSGKITRRVTVWDVKI
jgi:predicted transcriptional regulator